MILAIKHSLTSRPLVTAIPRNCLLLASFLLFAGGVPSFATDQLLIGTLLSRSTSYQLHEVTLKGTVGQVVLQPPRFAEGYDGGCTINGAYSFVLTDETGWILVDVVKQARLSLHFGEVMAAVLGQGVFPVRGSVSIVRSRRD